MQKLVSFNRNWTELSFMLGITTVLFFWGNQYGLGFTFDSFLYIDIAEEINTKGFWKNEGFNFRPPAFPLLIWLLGVENIIWANLSCLWVSLILIFQLGKEISSLTLRYFFYALIILATPLYLTHSFLWTEPFFTAVLLTAFFALHQFLKSNQILWLTWSLLAFLLLPTIRLAGTFISLPIFLWLFIFLSGKGRWMTSASIVLLAGLFLLWTDSFNSILSQGSSLLSLDQFLNQLTQNLTSFLDGFSLWFVPHPVPFGLRAYTGILMLSILGFIGVRELLKKSLGIYGIIAASFILYYFALHPYFQVTFYTAERYLSPMFALLLLTLFKWTDGHYENLNKWTKKILLIVLTLQCMYSGLRVTRNLSLWSEIRSSENYSQIIESEKTSFEKRYGEIKNRP